MYCSLYYVYLISDPDFGHETQYPEVMQVLGQWERSFKRVGDQRDQRRAGSATSGISDERDPGQKRKRQETFAFPSQTRLSATRFFHDRTTSGLHTAN